MNKLKGEHFVLTEVLGFTLLSLAAVLAKFLLTDGLDLRLFLGVALYFSAGVFKIKAVLLKKTRDRVLTAIAVVVAAVVYHLLHIPIIILLPLVDNIIVAAVLYRVNLRTTGWIEVAKSLTLLGLFIGYY
jgi:MFS-type transporter involved in bile tolerance (Atg22 family)